MISSSSSDEVLELSEDREICLRATTREVVDRLT